MATIQTLDRDLRNLTASFLQAQRNYVPFVNKSDESYHKLPQIDENTEGITTNAADILVTQEGVAESYEGTTTAITEVEEALAEIYEMIIPPEEG